MAGAVDTGATVSGAAVAGTCGDAAGHRANSAAAALSTFRASDPSEPAPSFFSSLFSSGSEVELGAVPFVLCFFLTCSVFKSDPSPLSS